jgi:hypothetical protein
MSYIKKKQVLGLQDDLTTLQYSLPILRRSTLFTGTPVEGEAILDSTDSTNITLAYINVNDNILGNTYLQIQMYNSGDNLIIQDHNKNIIVYKILSIENNVDSSNEGYFILTIQHSFGYDGSLDSGEFVYYFRRDTLSIDAKVLSEQFRAENAEMKLAAALQNLNSSTIKRKHIFSFTINENESTIKTITHGINDIDVIVQVIDKSTGSLHNINVYNYTQNTIDVDVLTAGEYKAIIIG